MALSGISKPNIKIDFYLKHHNILNVILMSHILFKMIFLYTAITAYNFISVIYFYFCKS